MFVRLIEHIYDPVGILKFSKLPQQLCLCCIKPLKSIAASIGHQKTIFILAFKMYLLECNFEATSRH